MPPPPTLKSAELFVRLRAALGLSQERLGALAGVSRRTIIRWEQAGATLLPSTWELLARASHPRDRELAAQCAAYAGHTLESLGIEQPLVAAPAPAPAPAPPRPSPSARHMADSVVCAAAEAMQLTPQAMRPGVIAALERVVAVGMTAVEALEAMAPEKPGKGDKGGKAGKPAA